MFAVVVKEGQIADDATESSHLAVFDGKLAAGEVHVAVVNGEVDSGIRRGFAVRAEPQLAGVLDSAAVLDDHVGPWRQGAQALPIVVIVIRAEEHVSTADRYKDTRHGCRFLG